MSAVMDRPTTVVPRISIDAQGRISTVTAAIATTVGFPTHTPLTRPAAAPIAKRSLG